MIFTVPRPDAKPWPSLGGLVVAWMEAALVFGPGDLLGQRLVLDDEQQWLLWRMYEVYPEGHLRAGLRRFQQCNLELAKGLRKTELAGLLWVTELHPEAPVRTRGWRDGERGREPVGGGVTDPYIPLLATSDDNSSEGAYERGVRIIEQSPIAHDFDLGVGRTSRLRGDGMARPVATAPAGNDGKLPTFTVFDETWHLKLENQRKAVHIMRQNLSKRPLADPWGCAVTTSPEIGGGSVAEADWEYARAVDESRVVGEETSGLFYYRRYCPEERDISTPRALREAIVEARGPFAASSNIESVAALYEKPGADTVLWEQQWLARHVVGSGRAFDVDLWKGLAKPEYVVPDGAWITLGFDGAQTDDAAALIATEVLTGFQWPLGLWEPLLLPEKQVPVELVDAAVQHAFERYSVWRMYGDPPYWREALGRWASAEWAGEDKNGKQRVMEFSTGHPFLGRMAHAIRGWLEAMQQRQVSNDGDARVAVHVGNCYRQPIPQKDDQGNPQFVIRKERPGSVNKIDAAPASVLSWRARMEAFRSGECVPVAKKRWTGEALVL